MTHFDDKGVAKAHRPVMGKCGVEGHDEEFDLNHGTCPQCAEEGKSPPRPVSEAEKAVRAKS